ncbi:MAG TPA: hypothetical protein VHY19_03405 [Steroidobacteraceae bacterium]|jgi:hypothetical protein|nr:hypothetical protein [Steroidobacteraceae bacterium]
MPLPVAALLRSAGLKVAGHVLWKDTLPTRSPGIYIIARVPNADDHMAPSVSVELLPEDLRRRWLFDESVVYIGRTKRSLRGRLSAFYRHVHGRRSPHAGGQSLLLLLEHDICPLWVYWTEIAAEAVADAEGKLIQAFKAHTGGRRPFANSAG